MDVLELVIKAARIRAAGFALLLSGSRNSSNEFATTLTATPWISPDCISAVASMGISSSSSTVWSFATAVG